MKHYLYSIRNTVNGKIYIGVHSTNQLDDNYMGSGVYLKRAINKYGLDKFEKTILRYFNSEEEMYLEEAELVDEDFVKRQDVYNLVEGGKGFKSYSSSLANDRRKWLLENDEAFKAQYSKSLSNNHPGISKETQAKMLARKRELKVGACHDLELRLKLSLKGNSPEAIEKKKATMKARHHQQGSKNSQYGKMWITDGSNNKTIMKGVEIPSGWSKGRVLKNKNAEDKVGYSSG